MAPVLSFTADEIWRHLPARATESVFLDEWHRIPETLIAGGAATEDSGWGKVLTLRGEIARELEKLRAQGTIGSGLDAEVEIFCDGDWQQTLAALGDELRFPFIVSSARVMPFDAKRGVETSIPELRIAITASTHAKCARCWHRRADVGQHSAHPALCGRCIENISGSGELRRFA
jgi:isoleucyl-tRNA synthetase